MQHFKFVNWWFRFLMSRTGYSASSKVACYQLCKQMMTNHKLFSLLDDEGAGVRRATPPPQPCWRQVLRRGRKNLHEFLFPRLPGTKDRSAIVLSQFKTRFHLHSSKSTRLEFRFCSENHSRLDMKRVCSQSVTSLQDLVQIYLRKSALFDFLYFFMNKIRKK